MSRYYLNSAVFYLKYCIGKSCFTFQCTRVRRNGSYIFIQKPGTKTILYMSNNIIFYTCNCTYLCHFISL